MCLAVLTVAHATDMCAQSANTDVRASGLVRVDDRGILRWRADDREVSLFGANYCLPSASDYRAAGYVGADRKQLVERDLLHFARMGWDGMRLCLWGDWENSDHEGNLIENDHLDVMDYAIAEARRRGIYILFTPITTYGAWWPDGKPTDSYPGFGKHFDKDKLGTDPAAIAAQVNYLRQMLEHVNPYTGIALKDDPRILFIEMINEPTHHPGDVEGSIAYINALVDAVRSTGCEKILFHNLSQDMRMVAPIVASKVQGATFAWYPTGLNAGHTLEGNHLRSVDAFAPLLRADLAGVPKIVYEFDAPDMTASYMYPAMVRAFREVGSQFAAMFSYDMLATAPYNLGWQTHFLNLVHSPSKAVSSVIAAEAHRALPLYARHGEYPDNMRFGPFRVSYEEDLSEMATEAALMYSNDTATDAPSPERLRRIVGIGTSPRVTYEGTGAYFLDRLSEGCWRLEVYPDAILIRDPYSRRIESLQIASRVIWRTWPMTVRLPDLGSDFAVESLRRDGSAEIPRAVDGRFEVSPGVYVLRARAAAELPLPESIGSVGMREFVCPESMDTGLDVVSHTPAVFPAGEPALFAFEIVDTTWPREVLLQVRSGQAGAISVPLTRVRGYRYEATVPAQHLTGETVAYQLLVQTEKGLVTFPAENAPPTVARLARPQEPLVLFDAATDIGRLAYTRIGDTIRRGIFQVVPAEGGARAALRLRLPLDLDTTLDDYTASHVVKSRIVARAPHLGDASAVRIVGRRSGGAPPCTITLVEADGTAWALQPEFSESWSEQQFPLSSWRLARGVKLPLGYPERWNYWTTPAKGRGGPGDGPRLHEIERVQISLRPPDAVQQRTHDTAIEISSISLDF